MMNLRKSLAVIGVLLVTSFMLFGCTKAAPIKTFKVKTQIVSGKGKIVLTPSQPANGYKKGTKITVQAVPDKGYEFTQWTGSLKGNKSKEAAIITANMTVGAKFVEAKSQTVRPSSDFIHTSSRILLDENNKELIVKGIAFGNEVWSNPMLPPAAHHTENSYKELSQLGFNSIRFYMNYGIFEDDYSPYQYKQSGWDWLDRNIAWAKKYKMHLVLNMHYPQGGFQSNGDGMALWTDKNNQQRLIALWKEIARRYKNEPVIMAFDLLNEPVVTELATEEETFNQWKNLAGKLVAGIREVDGNHMLIVERLNASKNITTGQSNWNMSRNRNLNFFKINDKNITYEFHMYEPIEFTHQNAGWIDAFKNNFSTYPDESVVKASGSTKWEWFTDTNPVLSPSKAGWQYLQGTRYKINDTRYMLAIPTIQAKNTGEGGAAWFDDLVIKEYDENDKLINEIPAINFDNSESWNFWKADNSQGSGAYDDTTGNKGKGSMKITGTTDDSNLSNYSRMLAVKQGHSYEISGYAMGKNLSAASEIRIRLDFFSCDSVNVRNKDYLKSVVGQYLKFGQDNNVPLYLGEFGCISDSFKEGRGGERWVSDMLDICMENKINFNYHTYHETAFGLYLNSPSELPANLNKVLFDVFRTKLK